MQHEIRDISKEVTIAGNIQVAPGQEVIKVSDSPTMTSQADDIYEPAPKRGLLSVSSEPSQQLTTDLSNIEKRLTAMLIEAGLADRRTLESLERTEDSLDDREKSMVSERFIREEWGTEGTMYKIYKYIKEGVQPIDVDYLVHRGPTIAGHRRVIAARCFTSILRLKKHGFLAITKDQSYKIKHISLGGRITASKRHD